MGLGSSTIGLERYLLGIKLFSIRYVRHQHFGEVVIGLEQVGLGWNMLKQVEACWNILRAILRRGWSTWKLVGAINWFNILRTNRPLIILILFWETFFSLSCY